MSAQVTEIEHELLSLGRALFEPRQRAMVAPLVRTARPMGLTMGRSAMGVLQDTLVKGVARLLAREVAPVVPAMPLHFSGGTFRLLSWLLRAPLAANTVPALASEEPATFADEVVLLCALELAEGAGVLEALVAQPWVQRSALACLHSTHALQVVPGPLTLDAVGALPRTLAARLVHVEAKKGESTSEVRAAIGRAQGALLGPLVQAAATERRWGALGLLTSAAEDLLASPPAPLDGESTVAARAEAIRQGVAPLRALVAIAAIHRRARAVGFVDDDYDAAQATLRALEPFTPYFDRAEARVRAADDLEELR